VARHRILVISTTIVALAGAPERAAKTWVAAVPVTVAVASKQDLSIYLIGLGAVQASFAEGKRVVVNGQYELRLNANVTRSLPASAVAKQARSS
jgi:hypothetical protein